MRRPADEARRAPGTSADCSDMNAPRSARTEPPAGTSATTRTPGLHASCVNKTVMRSRLLAIIRTQDVGAPSVKIHDGRRPSDSAARLDRLTFLPFAAYGSDSCSGLWHPSCATYRGVYMAKAPDLIAAELRPVSARQDTAYSSVPVELVQVVQPWRREAKHRASMNGHVRRRTG